MAFSSRLLSRSKQNLLIGGERISGGVQNSLSRVLGAINDTVTASSAKVNFNYEDMGVNTIEATNHVEHFAMEKHVKTISATRPQGHVAYSQALVRQLSKRRNWTVAPLGHGMQLLAMHQKCLFSSSSTTVNSDNSTSKDSVTLDPTSPDNSSPKDSGTLNPENSASKGSEEGNSGSGDKSRGSKESSDARKPVRGGPVSWLSFLFLVITGAGLVFYYDRLKKKRIEEINKASKAVMHGPSVGTAAIGGPFNLINHDGKNVTDQDFLGKWTLIYFGFTHCPDICPDELIKLAAAIDKIKKKAGYEIVPVFISVDPERDTVEQVREYVKEFHPKLIGLTGKPEDIRSVARSYRVYYMKTEEEDSDYLVDHSIVMYLMGPDMKFVKFFGKNNDVDELTDGIIKEIKNYKQ